MDSRTSELVKQNMNKASPFEGFLALEGKAKLFLRFEAKLYFIWAIPIGLTFSEMLFLKHGYKSKATYFSLLKWTSYILATVVSNFESAEVLRKTEFYTRLYPGMTKSQTEQVREAEILKRTMRN
jgi:hypothetical protein